jgi:hypothetical protein
MGAILTNPGAVTHASRKLSRQESAVGDLHGQAKDV